MNADETERIEIDLLLEAVYQRWGYDFRKYARASIERRIRQFLSRAGYASISEMIPPVLHDREFFSRLADHFSVPVTRMFRDPFVYRAIREEVIPVLRTWPHIKIWHAGCATGEEVFSLAILLKEEGILDRSTIYGTDFNESALDRAREGILEIDGMQEATQNYHDAGGKETLSEYYHARYNAAVMNAALRKRLVFSSHNLTNDSTFGEMHLILCRNVLIYFSRELQNRVLNLFTESLVRGGFLCLGRKEDLQFTTAGGLYDEVDRDARIYSKRGNP